MKIDWTKASAISEILSAIAILITLVFLTLEIRQSTGSTNASTRQSVAEMGQRELHLLVDEPELAELLYRTELTAREKQRLFFFLTTMFRSREHEWLQYRSGVLDEETWLSYSSVLNGYLTYPNVRKYYEAYQSGLLPGFHRVVREIYEDTADAEPTTGPPDVFD